MAETQIKVPMTDEEARLLIHLLAVADPRTDEEGVLADCLYHRIHFYRREAK